MKIGIDEGHCLSGHNTGASGCGYREELLTREVGKELKALLTQEGHSYVTCTVDTAKSNSDSLVQRVKKANAQSLDLFVSIHFNSAANDPNGNGKTTGTEVWLANTKHTTIASRVAANIATLGYKNRGVKQSNHYVTANTAAPAILVECCFIDDKDDMKLYDAKKMAKAIAEGILNKKIVDKQPATNTTSQTTYYRAVAGSYTVRDNANAQVDKLKKLGYSPFLEAFNTNGKSYLRVVVCSYTDRTKTEKVIVELKTKGIATDLMIFKK